MDLPFGRGGNVGQNGGKGLDGNPSAVGSLGGSGGNGGSAGNNPQGGSGRGSGGGGGGAGGRFGQGGGNGEAIEPFQFDRLGGGGGGGAGSLQLTSISGSSSTGSGAGHARICFGAPKFSIGGSVSGLTGTATLRLVASGEPTQTITVASGASSFQFPNPVGQAATWSISVVSSASGQDLVLTPDQGRVARSDISFPRLSPRRVCRVTSPGSAGVADSTSGSNWTSQARSLHGALADAACTELWVKGGVYAPHPGGNPSISFRIARNLKLYGGFAGSETALSQRLPLPANRSILTGDMGGNDDSNNADGNFITEGASELVGGNSLHVLYLDGTTAAGDLTPGTVIDNVVITAGEADGSGADGVGGGLVCFADAADRQCSPTLSNLTFAGNRALGIGGAIYNNASASGAEASPRLTNVTFNGNRSEDRGGAMYNDGRNGGRSSPRLRHVTLSNNGAGQSGAAIYTDADNSGPGSLDLDHVVAWANGSSNSLMRRGVVTTTIRHSLIQGGCAAIAGANCGTPDTNLASNPLLTALAFNGGLTPTLLPATGSPVIDAGNPESCAGLDQRGIARPQDGDINGSVTCDIGAVEIDPPGMSLGISLSGDGQGAVSADVAPAPVGGLILDCGNGGTCFANYANGSQVSLLATAAPGSDFVGWSGDCSAAGSAASAQVLMNTDRTCTAEFVLERYRVGGTVTGLSSGSLVLQLASNQEPATQTTTLSASGAFQFDSTVGFGSTYQASVQTQPAGLTCSLAFFTGTLAAADDNAIQVTCSPTAHLVGANAETGLGAVSPPFQTIAQGGVATVMLQPDAGWEVGGVGGTCAAGTLVGTTYRTGAVTAPCSVAVSFTAIPGNDPVCRVAVDGLAGNSGESWNAPKDLHGALADSNCQELWLKHGVYRPSTPTSVPASDRNMSFRLPRDLTLYGGFVGNETLRSQRDAANNRSILSGDIAGDDLNTDGNFIAEVTTDIVGNNSYHVLSLVGVGGASITPATIIDGITVTAGQANTPLASVEAYGGGLFCHAADTESECSPTLIDVDFHGNFASEFGGAICNFASGKDSITSPNLIRVRFGGNRARRGGGMSNMTQGPDNSEGGVNRASPTLRDVSFVGNIAGNSGGAMYNQTGQDHSHSNPTLERVTFSGNDGGTFGGAMANKALGNRVVLSPVLRQVTFSGNSAQNGGAMSVDDSTNNIVMAPVLEHVTFFANTADGGGGALYVSNFNSQAEIDVTLTHTILSQNTAATAGHQIYALGAVSVSMANSLIEGGCMAGSGISLNNGGALNCGAGNVSGDPLLGPLQDNGGFTRSHLPGAGSAAIDGGDNVSCAASDQRGAARPQDGDGNGSAICDIGALEVVPNRSLTVNITGAGSGEVSADPAPAPVSGGILDCGNGGSCSASYAGDSTVTLLASATNANSAFAGWGGDCSSAGTNAAAVVLMQANLICSANFTLSRFALGGSVSGLGSGSVVLQLTSTLAPLTQSKSISANGAFQFDMPLPVGSNYAASVLTQPAALDCSVANGSGTLGAADVGNIQVTCAGVSHVVSTNVASGQGSITPTMQSIAQGGTATVTLTPAAGWDIGMIGGTCPIGSRVGNQYTTGAIVSACTISVVFIEQPGPDDIFADSFE